MEVGYEKARYVSGYALAVNTEGKRFCISLSDIYEKAAEVFGVDSKTIPEAMY